MSASAAYDHHVSFSFPPRFLETELPLDGQLTAEMAAGFPADPEWKHEFVDGSLLVFSETQKITVDDLDLLPDLLLWRYELDNGTLMVTPNASIEGLRLVDGAYVTEVKADAGDRFSVTEPVALAFDPLELLDE